MNIFFLSLSLTVKGSYVEQLIRVSDLYNFIRIRIQEIKKNLLRIWIQNVPC